MLMDEEEKEQQQQEREVRQEEQQDRLVYDKAEPKEQELPYISPCFSHPSFLILPIFHCGSIP